MINSFLKFCISLLLVVTRINSYAQQVDSLTNKKNERAVRESRISLTSILTYVRVIQDASGNIRFDENFIPVFKLNKWVNLELGLRHGSQTYQTSQATQYGAYDHYKIELQTKRVKSFRVIARLSDNVIRNPTPHYSRSNYVFAIDARPKISNSFTAVLAYGYVFSYQQNDKLDAVPLLSGNETNYPIFKIGLQYNLWNKGRIGFDYGSYDTFNPYLLKDPFTQITFDYELSKRVSFYSFYRREFLNTYGNIFNRFFTAGVMIRMEK
ncbi:hypothetical protein BH10BAC4_BH10BAC4_03350 [soil metagenome]